MPPHSSLLFISHNFPPTSGPESLLVKMNAESLMRAGWGVKMVTSGVHQFLQVNDPTLLDGLPTEMEVIRIDSPEAAFAERFGRVGRYLTFRAGRTILPEPYLPWLFPATARALSEVNNFKPDIIYSRAPKHVSNVVGWRLKRATGLPWVAHFSDPWIASGLYKRALQRVIGRYLERRILRDADAVVFVSKQAADLTMRSYPPDWARRAHVIPHGYMPQASASPASREHRGGLKVIHAGAFYPTLRSPDTLFEGIRRLKARSDLAGRLEITCVGVDTTCFQSALERAGVADVIKLMANVSFPVCQQMIAESDLILVIDTPGFGGIFLPTKLIEGLAFRKPMLGLAEKDSAVAGTLQYCGMSCANLLDPDAIAAEFERLLARWESGNWGLDGAAMARVAEYEIDRVNEKLNELLRSFLPTLSSCA